MADGSQDGVLYIELSGVGIVKYDLATHTYASTGVQIFGTAFANGGDGFYYTNGPLAAASALYQLLPEDPLYALKLIGVGARSIEDLAADQDGTLYGVGQGFLFTVDKNTGAQTDLGPLGFTAHGLAFHSDGALLMDNGSQLMRWNGPGTLPTPEAAMPWEVRDLASVPGWAMGLPPPVPDGTFGNPLRANRVTLPAGTSVEVHWDATSCPAPGYHLLYGTLGTLPTYSIAGSACALGTSGTATWDAPAGNLWFLVVGDDGGHLEGTWGGDASGLPRKGTAPSGQCGMTSRNNVTVCAP